MENASVIVLGGDIVRPDDKEKYFKWSSEAYTLLRSKAPGVKGIDSFLPIRERPEYPHMARLNHYENLSVREAALQSREMNAVSKDVTATFPSRRTLWNHAYQLIKSFRNDPSFRADNEDTRIENAPIIHLEAYRLTPEDAKDYHTWLSRWGYEVYIRVLMKLPGLKGYDCYQWAGAKPYNPPMDAEAPPYLSILYFENITAYENYEKSPELASMRRGIGSDFPRALIYKWYVQYQLLKSWRK